MQLVLHLVPQGRPAQGLLNPFLVIALDAVELQSERHVLVDAHRERVGLLEDHADVAADRDGIDSRVVDVPAAEHDVAFEAETTDQVVHAIEAAEYRALAATGRANEGG